MKTEKRVLVVGCFDILHIGHVRFLQTARSYGDHLTVLLESDEYIKKYKQRTPFHTAIERAEVLSSLECVTDVAIAQKICFSQEEYLERWKGLHPDIVVITQGDAYTEQKKEQADIIGAECIEVPYLQGRSSSSALKKTDLSKKSLD